MNGVFVETQIGSFGLVWFGEERRGGVRVLVRRQETIPQTILSI